ncbi:hypothetical protein [uncultured Maritimibacter sp.]|uniref:hypothetical protein n=1 Tax=uncultured Maritimibacter sp. TaxID=991866 RepID=UPI002591A393|nr:hypothetical protein [uncultured Maritimibacter sp.]
MNQERVECPVGQYTQINSDSLASLSFNLQVHKGAVEFRATTDTTQPDADLPGLRYAEPWGERDLAMSDLFQLASAAYIWAKPLGAAATVFIDYGS